MDKGGNQKIKARVGSRTTIVPVIKRAGIVLGVTFLGGLALYLGISPTTENNAEDDTFLVVPSQPENQSSGNSKMESELNSGNQTASEGHISDLKNSLGNLPKRMSESPEENSTLRNTSVNIKTTSSSDNTSTTTTAVTNTTSEKNTSSNIASAVSWSNSTVNISADAGNILWATSLEKFTSHYEIERSVDGKSFEKIGKVLAKNQQISSSLNQYQFEDKELGLSQMPRVYYRIKHIGLDGSERLSEPMAYDMNLNLGLYAKILESNEEILKIRLASDKGTHMNIQILDPAGNIITKTSLDTNIDPRETSLNLPKVAKGDYFLFLSDGKHQIMEPFQVE